MSSTRRTPESRSSAKNSRGAAEAVEAAGAADAPSSGPAAGAAGVGVAVGPGDVAASARRARSPITSTDEVRHGRALLDPATFVSSAARTRVEARLGAASVRKSGQPYRR